MKPEQSFDNACKLATTVINGMDIEGVLNYAIEQLTEYYLDPNNKEDFEAEYDELVSSDNEQI